MTGMRVRPPNSDVVLAKARTHYPREWFGDDWLFGTDTMRNR
jgi:hypothetical protein